MNLVYDVVFYVYQDFLKPHDASMPTLSTTLSSGGKTRLRYILKGQACSPAGC
jgi:hypothetical protein